MGRLEPTFSILRIFSGFRMRMLPMSYHGGGQKDLNQSRH